MTNTKQLRIGILGTGAIGGFYGAKLVQAGFEVHFLARSEYAALKSNGLRIEGPEQAVLQLDDIHVWSDVEEMPTCDWVLVAAKTTSNVHLAPLINRMTQSGGKVVLMQNGLAVEDELRTLLRDDIHLLGGLCFICVHRDKPGVVIHQAYGGVNLGYHSGPNTTPEQGHAIAEQGVQLFVQAGLDSQAIGLEKARWQKLVWNVPYNGLSVLLDTTTGALMKHAASRALIEAIMQEVVQAATACGQDLPDTIVAAMLKSTERMPDYHPSMYHDFALRRPLELDAIYRAPIAAAKVAGVRMPKTEMLLQSLEFLTLP